MEFTHVGKHCEFAGCNQQDFLPFKCDRCGKNLCLLHRSSVAHDCAAPGQPDMTSVDCPICGKSFKFDRAEDPNVWWEEHFNNNCTKQPAAPQRSEHPICFRRDCRVQLGPSNTFQCRQCHQKVCLAHRIPEDHNCVGFIHKGFLQHFQKGVGEDGRVGKKNHHNNTGTAQSNFFLAPQVNKKVAQNKKNQSQSQMDAKRRPGAGHDAANTLKGSAHRRMQNGNIGLGSEAATSPPQQQLLQQQLLQQQQQQQQQPTVAAPPSTKAVLHSPAPPPPPPSSSAAALPSVCPFCNQQHRNESELVDHIIAFHPDDAAQLAAPVDVAPTSPPIPPPSAASANPGNPSLFREVCPICQARFADAVQLVEHVEVHHPSSDAGTAPSGRGEKQCRLS